MEENILSTNRQRLESNRRYSAKLSWKRKETLELRRQLKEFIEVNFDIKLPEFSCQYKKEAIKNPKFHLINEEFSEIIRTYYTLGNYGQSVGSLFTSGKESEVFTHGHLFSKHRIDPVWNWKKSKLIRTIYYNYLKETNIHKLYTPIHITLTLPHKNGKYKGKEFYANELITQFNLIRKTSWWNKFVYAGEYGVEITGNSTNGLHIHIHCLAFLYSPHLKKFRDTLEKNWLKYTGATEIWVESLYIHKKDDAGHFITVMKDNSKLLTYEQSDSTYTSVPDGKIIVRKKFYLQDEKRAIAESSSTDEEKDKQILELHTKAILETIKYHFKNDCLKLNDGNYNIFLINDVLKNTKGKRLYSRFGKFYNEPTLNFNRLSEFDENLVKDDVEFNSANNETVINPFTMEEIPINGTDLVVFYPEHLTYTGKLSSKPFTPLPIEENIYDFMGQTSVKEVLLTLIHARFKKKTKPK